MSKEWMNIIRENVDTLVNTAKRFGYDTIGVVAPKGSIVTQIIFGKASNRDALVLLPQVTENLRESFPENEFMIVASNNLAVLTSTSLVYARGVVFI